jgi:signal transduction histidine kinase
MIQDGKLQGDDLDAALESVQRNLQQITILVNDILFLQELELILQRFHPTNPGLVVAGAVEKYRLPASENGIQLHLQLAPDLPLVLADPKSLERAVKAVLENAIKFSPDGGDINIRVAPIEDEILIEVEDGGVGIPPEALPRIFERFFHLERIGSYTFSGTGIGLSIARQIIEAHRGSISIDSTLGKGTNARVRLPISKPANS